jgi:hypothetical protein
MLAGVCPAHSRTASYLFGTWARHDRRRVIGGTEAKLVLPNQVPEMRL